MNITLSPTNKLVCETALTKGINFLKENPNSSISNFVKENKALMERFSQIKTQNPGQVAELRANILENNCSLTSYEGRRINHILLSA